MNFDFYSFRFRFQARKSIHFPESGAGNVLRGALGTLLRKIHCVSECPGQRGHSVRQCALRGSCGYGRVFEPASFGAEPSGLADWPRPFVLRAAPLDGKTIAPGELFCFQLNLFETRNPNLDVFVEAFSHWNDLLAVDPVSPGDSAIAGPISIPLDPVSSSDCGVRVQFRTPTELKGGRAIAPEFALLFARAQDRVSTLRALYGPGPLPVDFQGMRARAAGVRTARCELRRVSASRRSTRTRQVHGLCGFVGMAEYEGHLGEFLPYLQAARWTGVGRHCVWGMGEVQIETL